jgi:3'-phosphoadenosine 5'-phosphosulfate sulfotransferase (PAPS reductase)/FAD synthetase
MTGTLADLERSPSAPIQGRIRLGIRQGAAGDQPFDPADLTPICQALAQGDAASRLRWGLETFGAGFVLTTSFGIQSAVLLHQISRLDRPVPVIWVDTGYLPPRPIATPKRSPPCWICA